MQKKNERIVKQPKPHPPIHVLNVKNQF